MCPEQHLLPGLHHAGRIRQDVDVLVLVVLVDPGAGFEERLHEQVQEGWHPDLGRTHDKLERDTETWQVSPLILLGGGPGVAHTQQLLQCVGLEWDREDRQCAETFRQESAMTDVRELRETQISAVPLPNWHGVAPLYC